MEAVGRRREVSPRPRDRRAFAGVRGRPRPNSAIRDAWHHNSDFRMVRAPGGAPSSGNEMGPSAKVASYRTPG